uniref:Phosphoglycerate mutase-like protein n=1 Tax=Entomoneis paludosa TaxID=265537 RepID=A0A7S3DSP5_9STRA|mmetsp:Transcript_33408/g.69567  ORF Transcript_33408/g.69567 Transcript_33408/m.69567 type:complete len:297 (+) Transcript_33408:84-974(+)
MSTDKEEAQHLIIIRHGDRWDYENPQAWKDHTSNRKGDPPLSALGLHQARETGNFLESYLQELDIQATDITWMSSPFLRCLQTSTEALNAMTTLQADYQIPILPEDGIFEWDGKGGAWHKDLPPKEERIHYFPRLLETTSTYQPLHVPTLPEPRSAFEGRCRATLDALHKRHTYKPKTALILVSHAACCASFAYLASNQTLQDITPAAPCSLYHLQRFENTPIWALDAHDAPSSKNGFSDHLAAIGSNTVPWNHFGDKSKHLGYTGPPTSRFAPASLQQELKAAAAAATTDSKEEL